MKIRDFYDGAHASRYLSESIIRIDGTPIFITGADKDRNSRRKRFIVEYIELGRALDERKVTNTDNQGLDMEPVPLGWLNFREWDGSTAVRSFRMPARMWKVGLHRRNFVTYPVDTDSPWPGEGAVFMSSALANTIKGKYPTPDKVLEGISGGSWNSGAFSRNFAVCNRHKLYYLNVKDSPVGTVNPDNGEIALDKQYHYLAQLLEKDILNESR